MSEVQTFPIADRVPESDIFIQTEILLSPFHLVLERRTKLGEVSVKNSASVK